MKALISELIEGLNAVTAVVPSSRQEYKAQTVMSVVDGCVHLYGMYDSAIQVKASVVVQEFDSKPGLMSFDPYVLLEVLQSYGGWHYVEFSVRNDLKRPCIQLNAVFDDNSRRGLSTKIYYSTAPDVFFEAVANDDPKAVITLEAEMYTAVLSRVSVATDRSNTVLSGVNHCFADGELTLVALDRFLLAYESLSCDFDSFLSFTVSPSKLLAVLRGFGRDLTIKIYNNFVEYYSGGVIVRCALWDADYPDYARFVPQIDTFMVMDTEQLQTQVRCLGAMKPESDVLGIRLSDEKCYFYVQEVQSGDVQTVVPLVDVAGDGLLGLFPFVALKKAIDKFGDGTTRFYLQNHLEKPLKLINGNFNVVLTPKSSEKAELFLPKVE